MLRAWSAARGAAEPTAGTTSSTAVGWPSRCVLLAPPGPLLDVRPGLGVLAFSTLVLRRGRGVVCRDGVALLRLGVAEAPRVVVGIAAADVSTYDRSRRLIGCAWVYVSMGGVGARAGEME